MIKFEIERIDHVALSVADIERSKNWYKDVLGLEQAFEKEWGGIPVMMGKGGTYLALFKISGDIPKKIPDRNFIAMRHLAFRANRKNFLLAQTELREKEIEFEFQDHGVSHSIYFKDPDGHEIEITTYELYEKGA